MDLLDIYDQHKNYVGQASKDEAHERGLWHWLSVVYVYDQQGKLLVQNHKKYRMLDHSIGGHVDAGELHNAAAHREAREELGVDIPLILVTDTVVEDSNAFTHSSAKQNHFHAVYECIVPLDWKFIPNDEVDELIPMTLQEVIQQMHQDPSAFTPGIITTMPAYLQAKGINIPFDSAHMHTSWEWR